MSDHTENDMDLHRDSDGGYSKQMVKDFELIHKESAVTEDGSGYFAAIKTREDFACNLFEKGDGHGRKK